MFQRDVVVVIAVVLDVVGMVFIGWGVVVVPVVVVVM